MDQKKFVFTGPESSGKTTLCHALASYFKFPIVGEYARSYLNLMGSSYVIDDLYVIAQRQMEDEKRMGRNSMIFCDTDLLTLYIWMEDKFGIADLNFAQELDTYKDRIYLLCKPDIPWEEDVLRENKNDRDRIFDLYLNALNFFKLTYFIIDGVDFEKRVIKAKLAVENCL